MCFITFITTIKICKNYEWLLDRINVYILCIEKYCEKYNIDYEILISEQVNEKNIFLIGDKLLSKKNVKILTLEQNYENPLDFNMLESYGKNQCLKEAKGIYCCMTSADQVFSEDFFIYIKNELKLKTFYRFATFSIKEQNISELYNNRNEIDIILDKCKNSITHLCNTRCFETPVTPVKLAQKSGDVMLLDTESFKKIKGWPETICFTHVDCAVCFVICNNFPFIVAPQNVCTYTMQQSNRHCGETKYINVNGNIMEVGDFEWKVCCSYQNKLTSN
jgi:hypothetical protein